MGERLTSAWVDKHYLGGAAGIDKNLIELRELDCVRKLIRCKSDWVAPDPGTAEAQVLAAAREARVYSGAAARQGA